MTSITLPLQPNFEQVKYFLEALCRNTRLNKLSGYTQDGGFNDLPGTQAIRDSIAEDDQECIDFLGRTV